MLSLNALMVPLSLDPLVTWGFSVLSTHLHVPHWCLGKATTSPFGLFRLDSLDAQG